MKRFSRQTQILKLIKRIPIGTQEELTLALKQSGFDVTQATVSRDIKELELIKVAFGDKQRYARNQDKKVIIAGKAKDLFRTTIVSFDYTGNLVILRTVPGMANAAGLFIEDLNDSSVVGTISGYDTVFIAMRKEEHCKALLATIDAIVNEQQA